MGKKKFKIDPTRPSAPKDKPYDIHNTEALIAYARGQFEIISSSAESQKLQLKDEGEDLRSIVGSLVSSQHDHGMLDAPLEDDIWH